MKELKKVAAKLTLVIEYEEYPWHEDIQELVDKARELGRIEMALLEGFAPMETNFS